MSDRGRRARRRLVRRERRQLRRRRLAIWFVFGILVSLVPLAYRFGGLVAAGSSRSLTDVLSTGDLFVIAMVVAASSVGDLISRKTTGGISLSEAMIMGFTFLLFMFGGWLYAFVSFDPSFAHGQSVVPISIITFAASVIVGASSIWVDRSDIDTHNQGAG